MANHSTFGDLSTTAASNTSIDNNDVSENCAMTGMNNAIRSLGAMGKGALTYVSTSGTDTYTATLAPVPDAYATGFQYLVNFLSANTSTTPSINLNSLGALTITLGDGATPLVAGSLNGCHILEYDGSVMRVLNPAKLAVGNVSGTLGVSAGGTGLTAGTSGGVLAFTASGTLASSAALTANAPVVGGGAGAAPTTGLSSFTNSLSGDVLLNNTAAYFDGPSVAQGTTGTWLAMGQVTISGSAQDVINAKLWDGTTVIASQASQVQSGNLITTISLAGQLASPAGNLRISVKDATNTTGKILFNNTGNSKDSTITAIRIA